VPITPQLAAGAADGTASAHNAITHVQSSPLVLDDAFMRSVDAAAWRVSIAVAKHP
jgi:hypothetical protein